MGDTEFEKQVMSLCEQALSREADDRPSFLEQACTGRPELREAVEKLINTVDQTNDFLTPVTQEAEFEAGRQIGDYRIVRNLGRGGMGSVYLAERMAEGYSQRVAIKVMRHFLQSSDMIARFNEERRILARLHHPYIARLMDGGTTEDGLPYLVTELIEGVPIDDYCDTHRLSLDKRIDLIRKVAQGLHSAHQNLVIHSDLKPGNILITEDGIPKLLDFGVARLAASEGTDEGGEAPFALTPDYSSPEQFSDAPVSTVSDVYSLGVLTYRLLVGETPYALAAAGREELMLRFQAISVPLPSHHIAHLRDADAHTVASRRSSTTKKLSRRLAGDLDAILLKALAPAPEARYPSALKFSSDLEQFVRGLPVSVGGQSASYRLGKFVRRNRYSVAAASLALVALCGGLAASLWQAHIANKRFDDLHGFAETVIFELHDEVANLPGGTAARQKMTQESLHYLDRLAQDAGGDRELQLDLARAYKRLGDVLGNPTNANLGDVDSAVDSYHKALAIAQTLSSSAKDDPLIERHKALVHEKLGDVLAWTGDLDGALEHSALSQSIFRSLIGIHPDETGAVMSVAISGVKRGDLLGHPSFPNAGRPQEALDTYREALDLIAPLAKSAEETPRAFRYYALLHERIGTMLSQAEQFDEAMRFFTESQRLREAIMAVDPGNANARRDAGIAIEKLGDVALASGNAPAAIPHYENAIKVYRALAESDPDNANAMRTLAIGLENLADALIAADDVASARLHFDELLSIRRTMVTRNPDNERFRSELEALEARAKTL